MATLIDGKAVAAAKREEVAARVAKFRDATETVPHLAAVLVGDDPASAVYVGHKQKACEKVGIRSTLIRRDADLPEAELLDLVAELNGNLSVHGILIQLPLPGHVDAVKVVDTVDPLKDVDCFHPENVGLLVQGRPRFRPCTPAGCLELIRAAGVETSGAHAVVLGRSEIVGKPMAALLQQSPCDATTTVCHSRTRNLPEITRSADILIAAVGRRNFVTADMVREGATVIDVGINQTDDGKLCGDVDFQAVSQIAGAITPVPGGVGPMTIAMLLENTVTAAELSAGEELNDE